MAKVKQETLVFKSAEIRRCIHHSVCATRWTEWSNPQEKDNLYHAALVVMTNYSGTYIMSAGYPRDKLRNKKIYSAYAQGVDNNVKEWLQNSASTHCMEMDDAPTDRNRLLAVIYLSVGENGHVYEEILAEAYETFTVHITELTNEEVSVEFEKPRKNIGVLINHLDMNREDILDGKPNNRRLITSSEN